MTERQPPEFYLEDVTNLRALPDIPWGIGGKSGSEAVAEWRNDLADRIERVLAHPTPATPEATEREAQGGATVTFHCEMRAMHGERCRWQCEECEDIADYQQTQRVSARTTRHVLNAMHGVPAYHPTEAQPTRCGGTEA